MLLIINNPQCYFWHRFTSDASTSGLFLNKFTITAKVKTDDTNLWLLTVLPSCRPDIQCIQWGSDIQTCFGFRTIQSTYSASTMDRIWNHITILQLANFGCFRYWCVCQLYLNCKCQWPYSFYLLAITVGRAGQTTLKTLSNDRPLWFQLRGSSNKNDTDRTFRRSPYKSYVLQYKRIQAALCAEQRHYNTYWALPVKTRKSVWLKDRSLAMACLTPG